MWSKLKNNRVVLVAIAALVTFLVIVIVLITQFVSGKGNAPPDGAGNDIGSAEADDTSETDIQAVLDEIANLPVEPDIVFDYSFMNVDLSDYVGYQGVVAYLRIPDSTVDFPLVQGEDNEKYLDIGYFGEENNHGAAFVDYRNNIDNLDFNNVVYAHNMADGTMFGGLKGIAFDDYSSSDSYIYLNSEGYKDVFQMYSAYEIDLVTFNFIQTGFETAEEKMDFIEHTRQFNQNNSLNSEKVNEDSKLITLVTCTDGGAKRVVVHGYLVDRQIY